MSSLKIIISMFILAVVLCIFMVEPVLARESLSPSLNSVFIPAAVPAALIEKKILVNSASHLDQSRLFISNIYEAVTAKDEIWTEPVGNGEYVKVTFEQNLTNRNDITIYARSMGKHHASIDVYIKNSDIPIARFEDINEARIYKVLLNKLSYNETYDVFYLKVRQSSIMFDYIVDPTLTIGNITTLCGDITAYDTIRINATGVLNICPFNTTKGTGYVNITLGNNGNFTLDAGGIVNGTGTGGLGGAGTTSSGAGTAAVQGTNGTGDVGKSSTTANGGGGGGAQRNGAATASGGGGGGFGGAGGVGADGINANSIPGAAGAVYGAASSPRLYFGSGGGGGAGDVAFKGASGGGGFSVDAGSGVINVSGIINMTGNPGTGTTGIASVDIGGSGGGSGGHIVLRALTVIISGKLSATGGHGGDTDNLAASDHCGGGGGGGGRILVIYKYLTNASMAYYLSGGALGISSPLNNNCVALPAAGGVGTLYNNQTNISWPDIVYPSFSNYGDNNGSLIYSGNGTFNVTVSDTNGTVFLEINNTNVTAKNLSGGVYVATYWFTRNGIYTYRWISWGNGTAQNINFSDKLNYTVNDPSLYPPIINLSTPTNNTGVTQKNVTFFYTVYDVYDNISKCSLIIDDVFVANSISTPLPQNVSLNLSYNITHGQHNWSIWCNDTGNFNTTSNKFNITADLRPVINSLVINDSLDPEGEVILSAGSTRSVVCKVNASDPSGPTNLINASATFYYYLNKSSDPDNNNVHYSNINCSLNSTSSNDKIFDCTLDVYYYANNGTWNCNVTVKNNQSLVSYINASTAIDPLYAVNLTDGITFGKVESNQISNNFTANLTNIGNMPINITLQGYARVQGDNISMNCTDNTNLNISDMKFSTIQSDDFPQKTSLNGSIQQLKLTMLKQTTASQILNVTYWQIIPDPGSKDRICSGFIIFSAEIS